ncbi:ATP-binding cassette domain-containing protein [Aerococcaceae bacterium DSM 111022]|nr:ATP-binding cassette domain-containing protein [Aerococcaceae bacterium DSM 111022]
MITIKNVVKKFGDNTEELRAVNDVSLTIKDREVFGIIGESGAGKSTLLRMINALESPSEGTIFIDDVDMHQLSERELRMQRKDIAMIFQDYNLLMNKTVGENVALPLTLHSYEEPLEVNQVLEFVGLLDKKNQYPRQLSGGQKQRVAIARALITRPRVMLCDEPTSALDASTTQEVVNVLKKANQAFDMTMVIVTHELSVVKQICDRAAVLEQGKLIDVLNVKQGHVGLDNEQSYYVQVKEVLEA